MEEPMTAKPRDAVERVLVEIEARHGLQVRIVPEERRKVIGVEEVKACSFCSTSESLVRWPCDAVRLVAAVLEARRWSGAPKDADAAILAALRVER